MKNRIVDEVLYESDVGISVNEKSLAFQYEKPCIIAQGEVVLPNINNIKAIGYTNPKHYRGRFQTQVGIAKAHKKCFGDEPVMSHEEYRQYVLANYEAIEQYYEDMTRMDEEVF